MEKIKKIKKNLCQIHGNEVATILSQEFPGDIFREIGLQGFAS